MKLYENYLTRLLGIKNETALSVVRSLNRQLADDMAVAYGKCKDEEAGEGYEKCIEKNIRKAHLDFLINAKKGLLLCDDGDDDCEFYINKEIDRVKAKLKTKSVLFGD